MYFVKKMQIELQKSVDPDQTAPCTVCPDLSVRKTYDHYDKYIQNFHLGRNIVRYMVENFVLRPHVSRAVKHNFLPHIHCKQHC